jgi:hypothetical protein
MQRKSCLASDCCGAVLAEQHQDHHQRLDHCCYRPALAGGAPGLGHVTRLGCVFSPAACKTCGTRAAHGAPLVIVLRGEARALLVHAGIYASGHCRPAQLDFTVCGVKPISEGHSLISLLCRGPIPKCLNDGAQAYKSPKIVSPATDNAARGSLAARVVDTLTYREKSLQIAEKSAAAGSRRRWISIRGSAGTPRVTHSSTNSKIKLRLPKYVI